MRHYHECTVCLDKYECADPDCCDSRRMKCPQCDKTPKQADLDDTGMDV